MKRKGSRFWLARLLRLLGMGYLTLVLFACGVGDRLVFMPPEVSYISADDGFVRFGSQDQFAGFYFPPSSLRRPVLLWAHGNAEDAGRVRQLAAWFLAHDIGLLLYDYPGYGLSGGAPSEEGCYRSAEAAFEFLTEKQQRDPQTVVLLGQSVGSGPSTYLAAEGEAAGLVLLSPFKSAFRVVTRVKLLPWDKFDNLKRMPQVEIPLLVVHGDQDEVVPFPHGKALYDRHSNQKRLLTLEGVGHNDIWSQAGDEVVEAIVDFVSQVTGSERL